jgi:predicted phage terminase large subunit-like protein
MQLLCDPSAGLRSGFDLDDIRFYDTNPYKEMQDRNLYILVDPANEKKKDSDYTAMIVVGAGEDKTLLVHDMIRDRLNLEERGRKLFELHRKWKPIQVRYERYGLQSDVQHIQYVMGLERYRFHIEEVAGNIRKDDRIERLVPLFKAHRILLPRELWYTNIEGDRIDLVRAFIEEEFNTWPNSSYKDMLDAFSRIEEPKLPVIYPIPGSYYKDAWATDRREQKYGRPTLQTSPGWMGA